MNKIAVFIKENRKAAGLTQEEFALRSGLGLRFVRELEQGKETVRMDKVNVALAMFNTEAVPGKKQSLLPENLQEDLIRLMETRFAALEEEEKGFLI